MKFLRHISFVLQYLISPFTKQSLKVKSTIKLCVCKENNQFLTLVNKIGLDLFVEFILIYLQQ